MEQRSKIVCPKCQGDMQPGVSGLTSGWFSLWFEVTFDDTRRFSWSRKNSRRVYDYRCVSCGYLERYATN